MANIFVIAHPDQHAAWVPYLATLGHTATTHSFNDSSATLDASWASNGPFDAILIKGYFHTTDSTIWAVGKWQAGVPVLGLANTSGTTQWAHAAGIITGGTASGSGDRLVRIVHPAAGNLPVGTNLADPYPNSTNWTPATASTYGLIAVSNNRPAMSVVEPGMPLATGTATARAVAIFSTLTADTVAATPQGAALFTNALAWLTATPPAPSGNATLGVTASTSGTINVAHAATAILGVTTAATGAITVPQAGTATLGVTSTATGTVDAALVGDATLGVASTVTGWLARDWPRDATTGRAAYALTVAHRDGTPLAALGAGVKITAPIRTRLGDVDGTGTGTAFQMPATSPDAPGVRQFRELQIYRAGHHLETCVLLRPSHDGKKAILEWLAAGLGWYFTKRRVGPAVRPELLRNPSFEQGLTAWNPGYVAPSIPAAPPKVSIVTTDVITGRKALRVEGSTAVQKTITRLGSDTTFAPGSAVLSSAGKTSLREFAKEVKVDRNPNDLVDIAPPVITIEGHTDDVPDYGPGGNKGLSERRAKAVYDYLLPLVPEGTTMTYKGFGDTKPIVPNNPGTYVGTPQNRRVDIIYPRVESARGHRQLVRQTLRYTNPSRHIKRNLTFAAYGTLESFKEPNLNGSIIWIGRRKPGTQEYVETSHVAINEETPLGTPTRWETSITVPADGQEWEIVVRLTPPAGTVTYDACTLKADDALEFIDVDYSTIVKGLVEHAQDPAFDKDDLNLAADVQPTGIRTTRVYYWHERQTIASCLAELAALVDGPDINIDSVARRVRARKRIGQDTTVTLAMSTGILDQATISLDGDSSATTVIVQADGSGADREEGVATGTTDDVDLVLEDVFTAEPGTRVGELGAQAARYHRMVAGHNPLPVVTADADDTNMLLDMVGRGDTVDLDIPSPLHDVTGRGRITSWSLDVDADRITYAPELLEV